MAIVGIGDPTAKETSNKNVSGPADFDGPGPHRYIGIGMVAGMAFIVLVLWLSFGSWPRRLIGSCWGRSQQKVPAMELSEEKLELESCRAKVALDTVVQKPEMARTREARRSSRHTRRVSSLGVEVELEWEIQNQRGVYFEPKFIPTRLLRTDPPPER